MEPVPQAPLPREPVRLDKSEPAGARSGAPEVGSFRQGSPGSRWALARYLVGWALVESVGVSLYMMALVLLALAVLSQAVLHVSLLAVLVGLVAVGMLILRAALLAVVRRLTSFDRRGEVDERVRGLVADTRGDTLRELRRLGLPSHRITLPLLALRLVGRRRTDTLGRLRGFDLDRAVPPARLDELHLVLRGNFDTPRNAPR